MYEINTSLANYLITLVKKLAKNSPVLITSCPISASSKYYNRNYLQTKKAPDPLENLLLY
jgi:hypothetical protein